MEVQPGRRGASQRRTVVVIRLVQTDLTNALRMFLAWCIRNTCRPREADVFGVGPPAVRVAAVPTAKATPSALIVPFGFHPWPHGYPYIGGSPPWLCAMSIGARVDHRSDWSDQRAGKPVEVGVGGDRFQRGSRRGSTWCDLRRRRFRRAQSSRRSGAPGDRADHHDNDTSNRTRDKRGEPDRDRDHAIGLRAGSWSVVAGITRRRPPVACAGAIRPLADWNSQRAEGPDDVGSSISPYHCQRSARQHSS
ncbi:MAG: hypothetical protein QOE13_3531 [Gaiellaceae bacterium]|nr:hypothetical protein [Mycobacterium sp.]MDX6410460.1 hypothetical protein [Gaiellaceae bacterium]